MSDQVSSPEVSVVIPSRNRWPLLREALACVLEQENVELEALVVDDGSSDETPERLAAHPDPRVRHLRNGASEGVARARNRGVAEARARWIAFLDDDDLWAPDKLRRQLDALERAGGDFSSTGAVVIDGLRRPGRRLSAPHGPDLTPRLLARNVIGSPSSVVVGRELIARTGGFDPRLSTLADWDLWLSVAEISTPAPCPEILVAYREHESNMHLVAVDRVLEEYHYLADKHRALADAHGTELGSIDWWRWMANAYRRRGRRRAAARVYWRTGRRFSSRRDLARAVGVLIGEQAMRAGRRPRPPVPAADIDWLAARCGPDAGHPAGRGAAGAGAPAAPEGAPEPPSPKRA